MQMGASTTRQGEPALLRGERTVTTVAAPDEMRDPPVKRLFLTHGQEPMPTLLTLAALQPQRAVIYGAGGQQVGAFEALLDSPQPKWVICARPRQSRQIRDDLEGLSGIDAVKEFKEFVEQPFDLAYTGGTKAMSLEAFRWWARLRKSPGWDGTRAWYLDDRSCALRSWPATDGWRAVPVADRAPTDIERIAKIRGDLRITWQQPTGQRPLADWFDARCDAVAVRLDLAAQLQARFGGCWRAVNELPGWGALVHVLGAAGGRVLGAYLVATSDSEERTVRELKLAAFRSLQVVRAIAGGLSRVIVVYQGATAERLEKADRDLPDLGPPDDRQVVFVDRDDFTPPPGRGRWAPLNVAPSRRGRCAEAGESRGPAAAPAPAPGRIHPGRHLLVTVGTNPLPALHAMAIFAEGGAGRITVLCSTETRRTSELKDALTRVSPRAASCVSVAEVVLDDPRDLGGCIQACAAAAEDGVSHVAFTGGTKPMAVAAGIVGHESDTTLWYAEDGVIRDQRGQETRPTPTVSLDLVTLGRLHSIHDWHRSNEVMPLAADCVPAPNQRIPHTISTALGSWPTELERQTAAALWRVVHTPGVISGAAAANAHVYLSSPRAPLEFDLRDPPGASPSGSPRHFEIDVCLIQGTSLVLFSCKLGVGTRPDLLRDLAEAQIRARQIGGDHARAVLVVHPTSSEGHRIVGADAVTGAPSALHAVDGATDLARVILYETAVMPLVIRGSQEASVAAHQIIADIIADGRRR